MDSFSSSLNIPIATPNQQQQVVITKETFEEIVDISCPVVKETHLNWFNGLGEYVHSKPITICHLLDLIHIYMQLQYLTSPTCLSLFMNAQPCYCFRSL